MKIEKKSGKAVVTITSAELAKNPKLAKLLKAQGFSGDSNVFDEPGVEETPGFADSESRNDLNTEPSGEGMGGGKLAGFMSAVDQLYRSTFNQPGGLPSALKQQLSIGVSSAIKSPEGGPLTDGTQPPAVDQVDADKSMEMNDLGVGDANGHHAAEGGTFKDPALNGPVDGSHNVDDSQVDPLARKKLDDFDAINSLKYPNHDSTFSFNKGKLTKVSHQSLFLESLTKMIKKMEK